MKQLRDLLHTLMPSSEKHGGTAEDSSSASESNTGNFSTADIGMSPL
jgi:hypothetical protein